MSYNSAYDITGNSFVAVGSGDGMLDDIYTAIQKPANSPMIFAVLVIMTLVIIYLVMTKCAALVSEKFNPGQTLRVQQREDTGASNYVQNQGVGIIASEIAMNQPKPGSAPYKILHDPSFNCAGRQQSGDNAWAWQTNVAMEKFVDGGLHNTPANDNALSKAMSGQ